MRKCTKCGVEKPLDRFGPMKGPWGDGLKRQCRACLNRAQRERMAKKPPAHRSWEAMRERCNRKEHDSYKWYGGRGIGVCPEWDSFEQFFADMGPRPSPKCQLDRIDSDGGYCAENCQWVLPSVNIRKRAYTAINMEIAREIRRRYAGRKTTYAQLGRNMGVSGSIVRNVLCGRDWREDD